MRIPLLPLLWSLACLAASAGSAHALDARMAAGYSALSLPPPSRDGVIVCHGFGCRDHTEIAFSAADRAKLAQILSAGKSSAAAERAAVATAGQWFDLRIGREAGTSHHMAYAGYGEMLHPDGQFDCIDASRNTTSLLLVLENMKLLKYHRVEEIVARGAFLDGRWPHATAVLTDLATRQKWAVDSWTRPAGQKPEVKPLAIWLKEDSP